MKLTLKSGLVDLIDSEPKLVTLAGKLRDIKASAAKSPTALTDNLKAVYDELNKIPGSDEAAKPLSDARRLLNGASPDPAKAMEQIDVSLANIEAEIVWRSAAKTGFYDELAEFETFARSNLGLREQGRLTPEQVDFVTPCLAQHRNLTLQF